jgi:hypothetical protein
MHIIYTLIVFTLSITWYSIPHVKRENLKLRNRIGRFSVWKIVKRKKRVREILIDRFWLR